MRILAAIVTVILSVGDGAAMADDCPKLDHRQEPRYVPYNGHDVDRSPERAALLDAGFRMAATLHGSAPLVADWLIVVEIENHVLTLDVPSMRQIGPPRFRRNRSVRLEFENGSVELLWPVAWEESRSGQVQRSSERVRPPRKGSNVAGHLHPNGARSIAYLKYVAPARWLATRPPRGLLSQHGVLEFPVERFSAECGPEVLYELFLQREPTRSVDLRPDLPLIIRY